MKDDIKNQIKIYFKNHEKILFTQDEILKKKIFSSNKLKTLLCLVVKKLSS